MGMHDWFFRYLIAPSSLPGRNLWIIYVTLQTNLHFLQLWCRFMSLYIDTGMKSLSFSRACHKNSVLMAELSCWTMELEVEDQGLGTFADERSQSSQSYPRDERRVSSDRNITETVLNWMK